MTDQVKSLTALETKVLMAFTMSDYGQKDSLLWMFEIQDNSGLSGKQFSGVCSSLTTKGLIGSDTTGDKGAMGVAIRDTYTIWLTPAGLEVVTELESQN